MLWCCEYCRSVLEIDCIVSLLVFGYCEWYVSISVEITPQTIALFVTLQRNTHLIKYYESKCPHEEFKNKPLTDKQAKKARVGHKLISVGRFHCTLAFVCLSSAFFFFFYVRPERSMGVVLRGGAPMSCISQCTVFFFSLFCWFSYSVEFFTWACLFACGFDVLSSVMLDGGALRLSCLVLSCFFLFIVLFFACAAAG